MMDDVSTQSTGSVSNARKLKWMPLAVLLVLMISAAYTMRFIAPVNTPSLVRKRGCDVEFDATNAHGPCMAPLVIIGYGCGGTSFVTEMAKRLIAAKLNMPVEESHGYEPFGRHFRSLRDLDPDFDEVAKTKCMVRTWCRRHPDIPYLPKIQTQHLTTGILRGLDAFGAKYNLVHRTNVLEKKICAIRDCFDKHLFGTPVFANGTKASLCFTRRNSTERTFAAVNIPEFERQMKMMMRVSNCTEPFFKLKNKFVLTNLQHYQTGIQDISYETLADFEYNPIGSESFNNSLLAWESFLGAWNLSLSRELIISTMKTFGINGRQPPLIQKTVQNHKDVKQMLANLTKDYCDWTWMAA